MTMKLYCVRLRGDMVSVLSGPIYGCAYVVAHNTDEAVTTVQRHLTNKNIGYVSDRELNSVELVAEATDYPACQTILYLDCLVEGALPTDPACG